MEQFHPSIPLESTASRRWSGCWFSVNSEDRPYCVYKGSLSFCCG
uniref:Uncharacterized protein n=1 Tax=Anguilla anguilla TaxID=7936 RepID=A0A0E9UY59_ANGAN